jgi:DoxX-like family
VSAPILLETAVGAEWGLARISFVGSILAHLGYSLHLLTIMGIAKVLAVIELVTPGTRRVKEWAYAGGAA